MTKNNVDSGDIRETGLEGGEEESVGVRTLTDLIDQLNRDAYQNAISRMESLGISPGNTGRQSSGF